MEYLNKVEIVGTVGKLRIYETGIGHTRSFSMSVVTAYAYSGKDTTVIANDWHNVSGFEGELIPDVSQFKVGMNVRVEGRLRNRIYTDAGGTEKIVTEVVARTIDVLGGQPLSYPR